MGGFSINEVNLIGNLGKDPEVRALNNGNKVCNLTVATTESWRDKASGERKEKTEWHRVVIFNEGLVGVAEQYLRKGASVFLRGALQTRKWTDQQGVERYSTEVVLKGFGDKLGMLGGRGDGGGRRDAGDDDDFGGPSDFGTGSAPRGRQGVAPRRGVSDMDDDIPFAPEFR